VCIRVHPWPIAHILPPGEKFGFDVPLPNRMPTLSTFFGIVIRMYYDDHPPPHFHAIYGSAEAKIAIATLEVIEGTLPRRALGLVLDWAELHQAELRNNWEQGRRHDVLTPIAPLE
jgi:Domain of unknown function (DUF4160)